MVEKQVSATKRIFSDIALTYHQFCKNLSIITFIFLFSTYFLFPIDDLSNRKFILKNIFNGSDVNSYLISSGILFLVSLVHFIYIIKITISFQNISFKNFFIINKYKLFSGFLFVFLVFSIYFLLFKAFNYDNMKFAHLWLYVFLSYLKLFIFYIIIILGTILMIDLKSFKEIFKQFSIGKLTFALIKLIFIISILDLILSPFLYFLENQLLFLNSFSNKLDVFPWIYYVFECLINTIIVMFFYNFIELLIHNKNRQIMHKKAFKKICLISLSFLYLFIWFTCGITFQAIARKTNGRDFIFQEDIKIKLQAKALKDVANIKADEYTICDLIKNDGLQKDIIYFKKNDIMTNFTSNNSSSANLNVVKKFNFTQNEGTLCLSEIGKYWGELYSSDFYRKGISHYRFEVKDSINSPSGIGLKVDKLYPVTIYLYKSNVKNTDSEFSQPNKIKLLNSTDDIKNYILINQYTILIDDPSFISILKSNQGTSTNDSNPMYLNLTNILQHSIIFIDYDFKLINDMFNMIENEGVRFPLLDFLYYSAVTITTTGYGDILPNSTLVRTLVMLETFFGVAIPGFFISLLFFKIDHQPKKVT